MTQSSPRRLMRSHDRVLGGVAGGLAEYLDVDPTIVRLVWVLVVVFGLPLVSNNTRHFGRVPGLKLLAY